MKSLIGVVLAAAVVSAQTVVGPTSGVSFTASTDHTGTNADGSPVVARYEVRFQPTAGCAGVPVANLAKPAPVANLITVSPLAPLATLPANCVYTLTVVAVGSGGEGVSLPSSPFVRAVPKVPAAPGVPIVLP